MSGDLLYGLKTAWLHELWWCGLKQIYFLVVNRLTWADFQLNCRGSCTWASLPHSNKRARRHLPLLPMNELDIAYEDSLRKQFNLCILCEVYLANSYNLFDNRGTENVLVTQKVGQGSVPQCNLSAKRIRTHRHQHALTSWRHCFLGRNRSVKTLVSPLSLLAPCKMFLVSMLPVATP